MYTTHQQTNIYIYIFICLEWSSFIHLSRALTFNQKDTTHWHSVAFTRYSLSLSLSLFVPHSFHYYHFQREKKNGSAKKSNSLLLFRIWIMWIYIRFVGIGTVKSLFHLWAIILTCFFFLLFFVHPFYVSFVVDVAASTSCLFISFRCVAFDSTIHTHQARDR